MTETMRSDTAVLETIREVVNHATAGTVFGTPISQDRLIVLPAAKVSGGGRGGGGSGGSGSGPADESSEKGRIAGGLGLSAKPLGVYLIKDGKVAWRPAVDVNRVIAGGQIVAVIALLTIRALAKARSRGRNGTMIRMRRR
jgi:uncharacterized spore protein YtfJ